MVKPVSPEESSRAYGYRQTAEREKTVELEWEMAVLGAFISATEKNGDLKKSAGQIDSQKSHGMPAETIGREVNNLISLINKDVQKEAPFPHFYFSDQSQSLVLESYLRTLETYYKALRGKVDLSQFEKMYDRDIKALFSTNISVSNPHNLVRQMDAMIETLNRFLPSALKIPQLPQSLLRG